MINKQPVKPFLKWAGGKSQLIKQIVPNFPVELACGNIHKYIEPFVGGGALFFHIAQHYPVEQFLIFDINPEVIITYSVIQKDVQELIRLLQEIEVKYLSLNELDRKDYFYKMRAHFNSQRKHIDFQSYNPLWTERAAMMIFLNKTCYNGLFRVNSQGDFNTPHGKYKNPTICDATNLLGVADILQKTQIYLGDYTICQQFVDQYSLVYFDPPYRPLSKTANFNAYSVDKFDDAEQLRLRDFFKLLDSLGAKLILSNSDPKNEVPTDEFFELAYQGYQIKRVPASRAINSKGDKRGEINEILIMNY